MNLKGILVGGLCLLAALDAQAQTTNPALDEARAALLRGDLTTAETLLGTVDENAADPNDLDFLRGTLAVQKKDYNTGIASFRAILARDPSLNRVRLDLAQAYYLKEDDTAAAYHFRAALAQGVPAEVAQNIARFLDEMRRRKRWEASVSASMVPDSNINAATTADSVDVFGLPFVLDPTAQKKSGIGVAVGTAGSYRWVLSENTRLKVGGAYFDTEYLNNDFSDRNFSGQVGPVFILGGADEIAVLATASRRWLSGDTFTNSAGARIEGLSTLSPRWLASGALAWENRKYEAPYSDYSGPSYSGYGGLTYALSASSILQGTAGVVRERADVDALRAWQYIAGLTYYIENLPGRFALGLGVQGAVIRYDAALAAFGKTRRDTQADYRISVSNAALDVWGFTPVLSYVHADRYSNINLYTYHRDRAEIGVRRNF